MANGVLDSYKKLARVNSHNGVDRVNAMKELELYIHIPFCARKCNYCDFLSFPARKETQEKYVDSLLKEMDDAKDRETYRVSTVFFGGGTPSILPAEDIARILDMLRDDFLMAPDAEVSMECNPGTLSPEKLAIYKEAGINRLSLGLQSADNDELRLLGRIHTWEDFLKSYSQAREAGFDNINVDLMSALPGQTVDKWEKTVQKALSLKPEHISAYSLIIEENTAFYEKYANGQGLPTEEEDRRMYAWTKEALEKAGYRRYEISNYALPGKECRHNMGYWRRTSYRGFGLGAASLMEEKRFKNTEDLDLYLKRTDRHEKCYDEAEVLSPKEQIEEYMFLGLRLTEGISEQDFSRTFGVSVDQMYEGLLEKLISQGLLLRENERLFLTDQGLDISNYVMTQFLLDP